jgi:hypothetical protein
MYENGVAKSILTPHTPTMTTSIRRPHAAAPIQLSDSFVYYQPQLLHNNNNYKLVRETDFLFSQPYRRFLAAS